MTELQKALVDIGLRHTAEHLDDIIATATKNRASRPSSSR